MGKIIQIIGLLSLLIGIALCVTVIYAGAGISVFFNGLLLLAIGDMYDRIVRIEGGLHFVEKREREKKDAEITERELLEEKRKNQKQCHQCKEYIDIHASVCSYCGFKYMILPTLTVFAPEDGKQKHILLKKMSEIKNQSYTELNEKMQSGMCLKFSSPEKLHQQKKFFESYGCETEQGEMLYPE